MPPLQNSCSALLLPLPFLQQFQKLSWMEERSSAAPYSSLSAGGRSINPQNTKVKSKHMQGIWKRREGETDLGGSK